MTLTFPRYGNISQYLDIYFSLLEAPPPPQLSLYRHPYQGTRNVETINIYEKRVEEDNLSIGKALDD